MRIRLAVRGRDLEPTLRTLIESYLWFATSPYESQVKDAHATLTDVQEASGVNLKHCRLDIQLCDGALITVEDRDTRPEAAVQRVAERSYSVLRGQTASGQVGENAGSAAA